MSIHKNILPHVALVYIKCFVSPHCYYSRVVKETGKLYAVIVEQPTKKEKALLNYIKSKSRNQTAPGKDKDMLGNQPLLKVSQIKHITVDARYFCIGIP